MGFRFFQWFVVLVWLMSLAEGLSADDLSLTNSAPVITTDTYVVQVGDKLSYRVIEDRDDTKLLSVSPGGEIDVPYYGRVIVAGKSLVDARKEIKNLLEKELYYQATVVLAVEETVRKMGAARQVYVVGQVRLQGSQEMPVGEKYTVSRAILKAGGFGSFANGKKVQVVRKTPDGKGEKITVDVLSVLKDGRVENDIELKPDDMVIVPEKLVNF
jgi:polysaccharide biosynthesis/export protein